VSLMSARKPRSVDAMATYLNAGLWGSRFVGDCQVSTNGETVWLRGRRLPLWVAWVRVASHVVFVPAGFAAGVMLGETLVGHWGYPPYYYLISALLTFLLVVLGLWGAGIWTENLTSYDAVSWPASHGRSLNPAFGRSATKGRRLWTLSNKFVTVTGLVQMQIPIGPCGKPRRLVLKLRDKEAYSVKLVLSGVYYGKGRFEELEVDDPWGWRRN
jgi:hypothetical protein